MNNEPSDVFEIKLTKEGAHSIRKFSKFAGPLVLIGALNSLIMMIIALARLRNEPYEYSDVDQIQEVYFKSLPYFSLVYGILLLMQLYYYWRIKKLLFESLTNKNEIAFNQSFSSLVKNAIWGIIGLTFTLLFSIFDAVVFFKYYY